MTRVFVTHMHPDHVGMAGWLTRKFDVPAVDDAARVPDLPRRWSPTPAARRRHDAIDFYRRAGWDEAAIETYRARFGNFGKHIHALPDSYRRHRATARRSRIGGTRWRVVVGNGHSPEHACLYCPELKVLISGDQVLPRISSNVSVLPDRARRAIR